jgi:hypothetical protein
MLPRRWLGPRNLETLDPSNPFLLWPSVTFRHEISPIDNIPALQQHSCVLLKRFT